MVSQIYVLVGMAAIAAASIVYVVFLNKGHRSKFSPSSPSANIRKERDPPTNFFIHNYFPSHSISIDVKLPTGDTINMVDMIKPLKTKGLTSDQVRDFLGGGGVLKYTYTTLSSPLRYTFSTTLSLPISWSESKVCI